MQTVDEFFKRTDYSRRSFGKMAPRKNIVLVSPSGAGTTSLSDRLRARYPKYEFRSGSEIMARMRDEYGLRDKAKFAEHIIKYPEFDKACDKELYESTLLFDELIVETRVPFISPGGCVFYVGCPLHLRAHRRLEQIQNLGCDSSLGPKDSTYEDVLRSLEKRDRNDAQRYDKLYPGWNWPKGDYDYMVSTENMGKDEVAEYVHNFYVDWLGRQDFSNIASRGLVGCLREIHAVGI